MEQKIYIEYQMRNIILSVLMLISINTFAQIDGNYNYSLGVRAYSLMQLPKTLQQVDAENYSKSILNGGLIKFNDNQMSFRIGGHFLKKDDYSFKNNCDNCEIANGTLKDFAIKLGFEKNFNYSVIQPYFGLDFGYRSNSFTGTLAPVGGGINAGNGVNSNKWGATASPIVGLKINFSKQASFFAESSLDFYYLYERQETAAPGSGVTSFRKYQKLETLLNPVSLGIQIHLVSKN